jgi:iron(II)-dependent oxidoreductase
VTALRPLRSPQPFDAKRLLEALDDTRERTLALLAGIGDDDLERVHSPLMSPLVWDLGHIAAFEDLWLGHRYGGRDLLRADLARIYDAFETPRLRRGDIPYLGRAEACEYLAAVRQRTHEVAEERGTGDGFLFDLIVRHEQQHTETMLQTLELAHLPGYAPPVSRPAADRPVPAPQLTGLELVDVPAGPCTIGAASDRFSYDNERPRHERTVRGFAIGRAPVTNATFLHFAEGGGYERREWWSDEGWSWKEEYDITHAAEWTPDRRERRLGCGAEPLHPDRPVVHVSWFEAEAFARAHGARLPTEIEWEKAATWDQQAGRARRFPWGDEPANATRANLDQLAGGTSPVGAHGQGASPYGCLDMLGNVWEWTASAFDGYPGFAADPYSEYSEVFFGTTYCVLRGGSWATRERVATPTFRNWDFPQRRQIFSGFRIARDLPDPHPPELK